VEMAGRRTLRMHADTGTLTAASTDLFHKDFSPNRRIRYCLNNQMYSCITVTEL
jgi:hypothetical protein